MSSFKILTNELIVGKLYRVIKQIDYYGCGRSDLDDDVGPRNIDRVDIVFGDILLFNGRVEHKVNALTYHGLEERRYHFINKTKFVYIKSGWINTKYLESIHDTTKIY